MSILEAVVKMVQTVTFSFSKDNLVEEMAQETFARIVKEGYTEASFEWTDEETGITYKGKLDITKYDKED